MNASACKSSGPSRLIAAALLVVFAVLCAAPEESRAESANRLVLQAQEALTSADFEPDPMARLVLLRRALLQFDRIVAEHPSNPLADQIIDGGKVAGASRPQIVARIAALRSQPEICFAEPGPNCLVAVATGFTGKFAFLRDRVVAYTAIADALLAMGNRAGARRTIQLSLRSALRIKSKTGRIRALIRVAEAQIEVGDREGAFQSLNHAIKAAQLLEAPGDRSRSRSQIAARLVDLQQTQRAWEVLHGAMFDAADVTSANARIELLTRLAQLFLAVDDRANAGLLIDSSSKAAAQIEAPYDRAWAQIATARALQQAGQLSAAADQINSALEAAETIGEPRIRASLMTEIAGLLAEWGAEDRASNLLDELLSATLRLEQAGDRREILWWIARTRIAAGHTPSARRTLEFALGEAVQAPEAEQSALLSRLAIALAETGDPEAAQNAIDSALESALGLAAPARQAPALLSVAVALARLGQGSAAGALLAAVWNAGGYRDSAAAKRAGIAPLLAVATALADSAESAPGEAVKPRD